MSAITIVDLNEDETLDKATMEVLRGGTIYYHSIGASQKFISAIDGEREEWSWDLSSYDSTQIGVASFR